MKIDRDKFKLIQDSLRLSRDVHWMDKLPWWGRWLAYASLVPIILLTAVASQIIGYLLVWMIENQ